MPTFARFFRWLFSVRILKRLFISFFTIVALITIAWQVENWRGRTKWETWKAKWEAKGEKFDLASVVSPEVPDDQNFAKSVLFEPLFDVDSSGKPSDQAAFDVAKDRFKLERSPRNSFGWRHGYRRDFAAWEEALLGRDSSPAKGATPVDTVLATLEPYAADMATLANDVRRPHSRFDIRYENTFTALLPHLMVLKQAAGLFSLRASARLAKGDTEGALRDTVTTIRLAESLANEPLLISQLVRVAILQIGVQPLWEGVVDHKWSAAHLARLREALQPINLMEGMARCFRGERNMINFWMSRLHGGGSDATRELGMITDESIPVVLGLPDGWIYQNQFHINRIVTENILAGIDLENRRLVAKQFKSLDEEVRTLREGFTPYHVLAAMLLPAYDRMGVKMSAGQAAIDQALIVTALESHRLAKGGYPASLAALSPDWLSAVPGDWFSDAGLVYRRNTGGTFTLYSIGYNETDDDGEYTFGKSKRKTIQWEEGDWPWPSAAAE
jgi:hypothetical protein